MGSIPEKNQNIICTMMKYEETFYGHHTALKPAAEKKLKVQWLPKEKKNVHINENRRLDLFTFHMQH